MRTTWIGLLLVAAGTARADMGAPGFKRVYQDALLEFTNLPSGMTVFVVCRDLVNQVPTTGEAYRVRGSEYEGAYREQPVRLCAVPSSLLASNGAQTPTAEWLTDPNRKGVIWSEPFLSPRFDSVSELNTRHHVVKRLRVGFTGNAIQLTQTDERIEQEWRKPLALGGGCTLSVLAVVSLFVWLGLKAFRRKPTKAGGAS